MPGNPDCKGGCLRTGSLRDPVKKKLVMCPVCGGKPA
jgi:hypothetical protein